MRIGWFLRTSLGVIGAIILVIGLFGYDLTKIFIGAIILVVIGAWGSRFSPRMQQQRQTRALEELAKQQRKTK